MIERFSQTAAARTSRWGRLSDAWNQPGASRWKRSATAAGPGAQLGRQRGHDLEPGGGDDRPEAELRGGARQARQEHRLGLVGGQARQARPVAVDEADAAVRAALGVDRDAGLGERLDVAVDRPDGDLELLGQLRRRHPAAGLEQEQDVDEPAGAHRGIVLLFMTERVRFASGR